jgi:periplasmic divalent cation tolerance protein
MTDYELCLITAPGQEAARRLADALLKERLAACVTLLPGAESAYWWKGAIERSTETVLLAKTRAALRDEVAAFVKANHEYETPEVIFTPVSGGLRAYLDWLGANTRFTEGRTEEKPEL